MIKDLKEQMEMIKEDVIKRMNLDWLYQCKVYLDKSRAKISFARIIFRGLVVIDEFVRQQLLKSENYIFKYFNLSQEKWDSLFVIATEANLLGYDTYPAIYGCKNFDFLNDDQKNLLLKTNTKVINSYFEMLYKKNINYMNEEQDFINKMAALGDKYNLSEEDLVQFALAAKEQNINVAEIKTVVELEKIYLKILNDEEE